MTDEDRLSRASLQRAPTFICLNATGCHQGDCLHGLMTADILTARNRFLARCCGGKFAKDVLAGDLYPHYDRSKCSWALVPYHLDEAETIYVCATSYCLLMGVSPSVSDRAIASVKAELAPPPVVPSLISTRDTAKQVSLDFALTRSYVASLINKHEADPAPGAHQPGRMTHITKQTWKQKWDNMTTYFADAERVPGSKSMLKRAWKLETRLKERRAKTHSKCNICAMISAALERLTGKNSQSAQTERRHLLRLMKEHDANHLAAREVLDEAGLMSMVQPRAMWTILVDAATQRNFELPKFQFRPPKCFTGRPFWSFKLMACYVYGSGFYPFLIHDSQKYGANLTWTVIWLTLSALYAERGYWPKIIHIQLDNTKGENKNEVMVMISAWMAGTKVQQVRVFFLPVGHTHILIDHIFGIITVGLRRVELLTPEDLMANIDGSMARNPIYSAKPTQWLHCLFDFTSWAKSELQLNPLSRLFDGEIQDEDGNYNGMFDLLFTRDSKDIALLQYREHCSHPYLPTTGPCLTIKKLPLFPPKLQEIKPRAAWAFQGSNHISSTITLCCQFARTLYDQSHKTFFCETWNKVFNDVPEIIGLLKPGLQLRFEYFTNDCIPRLQHGPVFDEHTPQTDLDYDEWKRRYGAFRAEPLAFDPVISSQQSVADYKRNREIWLASRTLGGPTVAVASTTGSSGVLLGSFVIAAPSATDGVSLFSIRNLGPMMTMYSLDLSCTGVLYNHTPNPKVSGLFGTFKMATTRMGNRNQECRSTLRRDQILVSNAKLDGKGFLTLDTLRCLACVLPEQYPLPPTSQLPTSHNPKRLPEQVHTQNDSSSGSSNDEDDSDTDDNDEQCTSRSDTASSSSDSEPPADLPPSRSALPALATVSYTWQEVKEGELVFLDMHGSTTLEYKSMSPAVALVFVARISADEWNVHWYSLNGRNFNLKNKYQTWTKFWTHPAWARKEKLKKHDIPSTDLIFKYWYAKTVSPESMVPIRIPPDMYVTAKVIQSDTVRLPTALITDVLLPLSK